MYPPLSTIRECSLAIATYVAEHAYETGKLIESSRQSSEITQRYPTGLASTYPEPEDKKAFISSQLYDFNYDNKSALPDMWEYPTLSKI